MFLLNFLFEMDAEILNTERFCHLLQIIPGLLAIMYLQGLRFPSCVFLFGMSGFFLSSK